MKFPPKYRNALSCTLPWEIRVEHPLTGTQQLSHAPCDGHSFTVLFQQHRGVLMQISSNMKSINGFFDICAGNHSKDLIGVFWRSLCMKNWKISKTKVEDVVASKSQFSRCQYIYKDQFRRAGTLQGNSEGGKKLNIWNKEKILRKLVTPWSCTQNFRGRNYLKNQTKSLQLFRITSKNT